MVVVNDTYIMRLIKTSVEFLDTEKLTRRSQTIEKVVSSIEVIIFSRTGTSNKSAKTVIIQGQITNCNMFLPHATNVQLILPSDTIVKCVQISS